MNIATTKLVASSAALVSLAAFGGIAFAQSGSSASRAPDLSDLDPAACSAALDLHESVISPAESALHDALQDAQSDRIASLKAALALSDEAARGEAIKAANAAFRTSMEAAHETFQTATKDAHEEIRESCGGLGHGIGPMMVKLGNGGPMDGKMGNRMFHMRAEGPGKIAEKFNMTPEEFKAAIESGKTIEEIAEEQGVELPDFMEGRGHKFRFGPMHDEDEIEVE